MIRHCQPSDMKWLIDKAFAFNSKYYDVPLDIQRLEDYLWEAIHNPNGVVLRSEHSAIVGVVIDDPFRDWKVLVEIAWYSEGRDGLRLLDTFEDVGRCHAVNEIRMTTLEVNKGVEKVLARRGYKPIETSHRLLIKD